MIITSTSNQSISSDGINTASNVEILINTSFPIYLYTETHVTSTTSPITYQLFVGDIDDCEINIHFDDGNGNTTLLTELTSNEQTAFAVTYNAEGIFSPSISAYKTNFDSLTSVVNFYNFVVVKNGDEIYQEDSDRQLFTVLEFPHNKESMTIKPSDFVKSETFNLVIDKYWENLEYLISQLKVYSQDLPYVWNSWFDGTNWKTGLPNISESSLSGIKDVLKIDDKIFLIVDKSIVIRDSDYNGTVLATITNTTNVETFTNPISFVYYNDTLLVLDKDQSMLYSFSVDGTNLNLDLYFGGFGYSDDNYKFNYPNHVFFNNTGIYICDTENLVVKKYTDRFHWTLTISDLEETKPLKVIANDDYIFVLCDDKKIRKYNQQGEFVDIIDGLMDNPLCIHIDGINPKLFYVFGEKEIALINEDNKIISYYSGFPEVKGVYQNNKEFLCVSDNYIGKFVDYLTYTSLGDLNIMNDFWSKESLKFDFREFSQHILYNDSFGKMMYNLNLFLDSVTAKPVNYYGFDGSFLYRTFRNITIDETTSCSFDYDGIGLNEVESYEVLNREWNKVWDTMNCVLNVLQFEKNHLEEDDTNCVIWKDGVARDGNKTIWPISWEEMDCELSEMSAEYPELSGLIYGILPQLWTPNQLRCLRYNAPTIEELTNSYLVENSLPIITINMLSCNIINNPAKYAWQNLIGDCCPVSNIIPIDYENPVTISDYAWTNFECASSMSFTWEEAECDNICGQRLSWEFLTCAEVTADIKYFSNELILEDDCL